MKALLTPLTRSPVLARVVPFFIFLILTACQGLFGEASRYWFYLAKTMVGAWLIWVMKPYLDELKWVLSWPGVAIGIVVFLLWVGLDGRYPTLEAKPQSQQLSALQSAHAHSAANSWNPRRQFGNDSALAWFFLLVRIIGSSLVVPPLEEVFYRSFLYRYLIRANFLSVSLGQFHWRGFLGTALLFGLTHREWLAGILCGLAYQGLVCWKGRLGDAVTAHAVTNFLLGVWVVWKGAWQFW